MPIPPKDIPRINLGLYPGADINRSFYVNVIQYLSDEGVPIPNFTGDGDFVPGSIPPAPRWLYTGQLNLDLSFVEKIPIPLRDPNQDWWWQFLGSQIIELKPNGIEINGVLPDLTDCKLPDPGVESNIITRAYYSYNGGPIIGDTSAVLLGVREMENPFDLSFVNRFKQNKVKFFEVISPSDPLLDVKANSEFQVSTEENDVEIKALNFNELANANVRGISTPIPVKHFKFVRWFIQRAVSEGGPYYVKSNILKVNRKNSPRAIAEYSWHKKDTWWLEGASRVTPKKIPIPPNQPNETDPLIHHNRILGQLFSELGKGQTILNLAGEVSSELRKRVLNIAELQINKSITTYQDSFKKSNTKLTMASKKTIRKKSNK